MAKDEQDEFQEVGHCGGQLIVSVSKSADGRREIGLTFQHSRPTAASLFAIYALPPGIPIGTIRFTGIGGESTPPPISDAQMIFIGSDRLGMFGHQCPNCNGYWRSDAAPAEWPLSCPYCGLRAATHHFLTPGQKQYVHKCCNLILEAINSDRDGDHVIDMDEVADAVGKDTEKPAFYYAEESQQNKFKCTVCGTRNDILGKYGYCSCCGTHNGLHELEMETNKILERAADGTYEVCVKDAVSAFDSYARQMVKQLTARIPMTPSRRRTWERRLFHNLADSATTLKTVFDIDIIKSMKSDDVTFATLMFHRRHVYEHNGGEVDEKYIRDSGDQSVRVKQVIHETPQSVTRIVRLVQTMGGDFQKGFHAIFPPEDKAMRHLK